jgi:hypothetical protein
MSIARHHTEWLSLIENSGPFLSMPVLNRVFPQGLEPRDSAKAAELREAYAEWQESGAKVPAVHHAWIKHVLRSLLEYPTELLAEGQGIPPGIEATMANFGETLLPDLVLKHREPSQKPVLLINYYAPQQDLEKPVPGKLWKASPGTRMAELLHVSDIPLGLITNGEQWMIVYAPRGETTGFASWYADLWMQEPITLRAFHSLLHLRRLLGVAAPDTLSGLYAASSSDQQEVTDQLGRQVRQSVEMLVRAMDRLDEESGRELLNDVSEKDLYNGALTVMMRLVFLFSAEERGLLLLGDPLYDQHYAVSTLSQLLRERADEHGEEVLERRQDAWCRLLSTFRGVHGGIEHEALRLPPYGGTLFDPDRYPFLEGRDPDTQWRATPAQPLAINNRVVLHLLESLQFLKVKVPGGGTEARRLSFRALDIEQIGHVYEGLLDHVACRASEIMLGLAGAKNKESEISLSELEVIAGGFLVVPSETDIASDEPTLRVAENLASSVYEPNPRLIEFLEKKTGKSEKAIRKALTEPPKVEQSRLWIACGRDPQLVSRVTRFAGLLRSDEVGQPVVIPKNAIFVTAGSDRRSTGTHYTPRSLTEPIVQYTLEPLVYIGPAEGHPKEEWRLKAPKEILSLKVCDLAMGSGAFLVQTCRYLGERLVEAWENVEKTNPGKYIATPDGELSAGDPSERLIPADAGERLSIARRYVADRCLYGVDINSMAVEMAKLSLWLITLQRDRPFTFLDHALKCGDSLLGVSSVKQIENFSLRPGERQVTFATVDLAKSVEEASAKRRALEDLPSNDHCQIETKNRLHAEAEAATSEVKAIADCLIAFELCGLDGDSYEDQRTSEAERVQLLITVDAAATSNSHPQPSNQLSAHAKGQLDGFRPFHWAVEFPEAIMRGGFDAFVGNPPFIGGRKIRGALGGTFLNFLTRRLYEGTSANADICAFFVRRANDLTYSGGSLGFVATSSMSEGDTRAVCLQHLLDRGSSIIRASSKAVWPGTANVTFSPIWIVTKGWGGNHHLDGRQVKGINSYLMEKNLIDLPPFRLKTNYELSFQGSIPLGTGFVLQSDEAQTLLEQNKRNEEVIFPYLVGQELNIHPAHEPSQWIINFHDWPLDRESSPADYTGPVVVDYPECYKIIRERVYPERTRRDETGNFVLRKPLPQKWWIYGDKRPELYAKLKSLKWALAIATQATKYVAFGRVSKKMVYSNAIAIIATDSYAIAGVLFSSIHENWARRYASYNLLLLRYSPSDVFDTFPLPLLSVALERQGKAYHDLLAKIMIDRGEGLTKTYNRFHDPSENSEDIARLRALHEEMDQAVAAAYGWSDLDLGHGFHATKQGERYTLSEPARHIVLDRLLALNHQRYDEEVKAGLHDKGAKKKKPREEPENFTLQ